MSIINLTDGQPFTPTVAAATDKRVDAFDVGSPVTESVRQIAENGDTSLLIEELAQSPRVADLHVGTAPPC